MQTRLPLDKNYIPGSVKHSVFINREIENFKKYLASIEKFDRYTFAGPAALSLLFWFTGYVTFGPTAFLCAALSFGNYTVRPEFENNHQAQLLRLLEIYEWCIQVGPAVTKDKNFLALTEVMAPYFKSEELLKSNWESSKLADEYKQILVNNYHPIQPPAANIGFLGRVKNAIWPAEEKSIAPVEKTVGGFNVSRAIAEGRYRFYGYRPMNVKSEEKSKLNLVSEIGQRAGI